MGVAIAVVFLVVVMFILSRWRKAGPNEALIISGIGKKHGFRIVQRGGTFVWPVLEQVQVLSLEIMTLDVNVADVYTAQGVPVTVDEVAQVKVRGDETAIATAAEQFLGKTPEQIREIARQTLEGHLRAIVGTMTVEELYRNRDAFAQRIAEVAESDLANMGLTIVSFTIRDKQGYLDALSRPRIAQVKRDARIAEAEAEKARGLAEAMMRKAEAWQAYNQVAITEMFIERLPEITRTLAEPLSKVERIVVISNTGDGIGTSRITQDIVNMMAQIPPVLESLTGINVRDLITRLSGI